MKKKEHGWGFYIGILITLGFLSMIFAGIMAVSNDNGISVSDGNIALIPIKGIIVSDSANGFLSGQMAASTDIVNMIEKADSEESIKGIILEIDSPGGMVVPTDEISQAIKHTNKTTIAWVRSIGASGGYWIATSTDKIFANRMSVVGSIGVISSYLQFSDFIDQYNVSYERLVAGKYKDMGSPFKNLTVEERQIYQTMIDKLHGFFIDEVAANRKIDRDRIKELATGQVYLGFEAKNLGLIDEIGGKREIEQYLKKKLDLIEIKIAEYKKQTTFIQRLTSVSNEGYYNIGRGIGASFVKDSKVPNYPTIWY